MPTVAKNRGRVKPIRCNRSFPIQVCWLVVGAWLVVGLPVIAARLWWTVPAALLIFAVTLTAYVMLIVRQMRRHSTC